MIEQLYAKSFIFVTKHSGENPSEPSRVEFPPSVLSALKFNQQPHGKPTFLNCHKWPKIRQMEATTDRHSGVLYPDQWPRVQEQLF